MLAAEWVPMTGADGCASVANRLLAFVAGEGMSEAVGSPTLRALFDMGGAETVGAAGRGTALKMNVAVIAAARGVCTARRTGRAADFPAGAAEDLIFGAGHFVAAGAAHRTVDAERCLVDVAGKRMRGTGGASAGRAGTGTGDTNRAIRDRTEQAMIGAGMVPAIFGFDQAGVTDARAIDGTYAKGMFAAASMSAACAYLDTCLAYQVRRALAIAYLGHYPTTGAARW